MVVRFTVPGAPFGKPRPRATRNGRLYRCDDDISYEHRVRMAWVEAGCIPFPDDTPIRATIYAYYAIPNYISKKKRAEAIAGKRRPTAKPDCDNIGKAITDPLNKCCYDDDSRIVEMNVIKFYSENPRVEVVLEDVR